MMRFFGGVCLLLGTFGVSALLTHREKQRASIYGAILDWLRYISAEIRCFGTPRERLFSCYESEVLEKCGFLSALRSHGAVGDAIKMSRIEVSPAHVELLKGFDKALGGSYTEEQLTICAYYIDRWAGVEREVREGLPQRLRLTRTVTLSLGMLLLLLLL